MTCVICANYVPEWVVCCKDSAKPCMHLYTVKTFWLLQPYFGHLSCMPDVCVTHYKTSKGCFLFESKLKCSWEASLSHILDLLTESL